MRFLLLTFAAFAASTFAFGGAMDPNCTTRALKPAHDIATLTSAQEHAQEFKHSLRHHKHHKHNDDDDDDDDD
ncbi:hypothetical protein PR003_g10346 [Phytophthora rubi]|uniref:RxLR effector protein n=1 Tax=Phytophthora rubi TaxID=129364 RepID=A0A6A3MXA3_9STRA|nr:hypothetical protein PR002_g9892 [Phytophthora rubi]KAE9033800.1 hypothetical protein PR001_g10005 [Phytophthora rubi]KAE9340707.1 hypothetical protein PR003_g10346 [Phytophthora rubi]